MLFSVIVPVYNAKPYLEQCVTSVLEQSCADFELILVDDGSSDGSSPLCDQLRERDGRIQVLHQENSGVVAARGAGLAMARGDYILSLDADDWLDVRTLELAEEKIAVDQPQVISFAHMCESMEGSRYFPEPVEEGFYDRESLKQKIWPKVLMDESMCNMHFPNGKVSERMLLMRCMDQMETELTQGEDAAISYWLYRNAERVWICGEGCYHYRITEQSMSHGFRMDWYAQIERTIRYFEKVENPLIPDFEDQLHRYTMMVLFSILLMMTEAGARDQVKAAAEQMKRECFQRHIHRAWFQGISPKTSVTFFLIRRGWIKAAYDFLVLCEKMKRGGKKYDD